MRKGRGFCSQKASLALLSKSQTRFIGVVIADHGVRQGSFQLPHVAVQTCPVKPVKIGAECEHPHRDPAARVQEEAHRGLGNTKRRLGSA